MFEFYYDLPPIVQAVSLLFAALVVLIVALILLALMARAWKLLKRELQQPGVRQELTSALATVEAAPGVLRPFVDEKTDPLILLLASLTKAEPDAWVLRFERWLKVAQGVSVALPEIKDALGLTVVVPPKPAETGAGEGAAPVHLEY